MVQGKINRGRHTDHPAGRHSIQTNQCPPPPSPIFLQAGCPFCRPTNSVKALNALKIVQNTQHISTQARNSSNPGPGGIRTGFVKCPWSWLGVWIPGLPCTIRLEMFMHLPYRTVTWKIMKKEPKKPVSTEDPGRVFVREDPAEGRTQSKVESICEIGRF